MVNPSDGLHLSSDSKVDIIVTSMTGQVIKYAPNVNVMDLDLEVGAYAVDISNGSDRSVKKLIVVN